MRSAYPGPCLTQGIKNMCDMEHQLTHDLIKSEFEDIPISNRIFDDSTEGKIELGRHPLQKIFATTPMSKLMKLLRADVSLIFLKGLY